MSSYLKPQSPLYHKKEDAYFYPMTTVDQVVLENGNRLDAELSKHLMIDTEGSNETEPNGINADTLGGYAADEYMRKSQGLVEVNYSVVGGLTEPENPTQNMIWIQTETPIGRVFFGNSEPNETFMEGDVWIFTGNGSRVAFNSLKIVDVYMNMVYPLSVKQYINSTLNDMTAKSYQNGNWVDWWDGELYFEGNEYEDITGGLEAFAQAWSSSYVATKPNFTKNEESFTASLSSGSNRSGVVRFVKKIDLTNYKTLRVPGLIPSGNGREDIAIWSSESGYVTDSRVASAQVGEGEIDISAIDGSYFVGFAINANNQYSASLTASNIRLERS